MNPLFISVGILLLFISTFGNAFIMIPLQEAIGYSTPRLIELFSRDRRIFFSNVIVLLFSMVCFFYAFEPTFFHSISSSFLFGIWLILLGITLDFLLISMMRTVRYFNPFALSKIFVEEAKKSIAEEKDTELCDWIDSLTEIAGKAINPPTL